MADLEAVLRDALVPLMYDDHRMLDETTAYLAADVRAWLAEVLLSEAAVNRASKAVHASWWHDSDGECDDPSGCGATVDDVKATIAALQAAVDVLAAVEPEAVDE